MRRLGVLLLVVALGSAGCATADHNVADGRVATIDWVDSRIRLDTGETFDVPERHQLNRLETGNRVAVSYIVENGRLVATQIWRGGHFP